MVFAPAQELSGIMNLSLGRLVFISRYVVEAPFVDVRITLVKTSDL